MARTPCWIMRQAGRYLPEYRALRERNGSFTELLQRPQVAAELAMQPLARYDLDAAIVFSDILVIPDAMGLGLYFEEGSGPQFERPLTGPEDAAALRAPDPEKDLGHVLEAVRETLRALDGRVPLIGFAGAPWTIFVYMVEAGGGDRVAAARNFARRHPEATHRVLSLLAQAAGDLLLAQRAAGAEVVMLFDSWGGALEGDFARLSLPFLRQICQRLGSTVPLILYVRGADPWLEALAGTGCQCLGLDESSNLGRARQRVGDRVALQGNLDPACLEGTAEEVVQGVRAVLQDYGPDRTGHVFNLARGIAPQADPELVQVLVEEVRRFSSGR